MKGFLSVIFLFLAVNVYSQHTELLFQVKHGTITKIKYDSVNHINYVAGFARDSFTVNDSLVMQSGGNINCYFASLNDDGKINWLTLVNNCTIAGFSLDKNGNIYAGGRLENSVFINGKSYTTKGNSDAYVIKLNNDGSVAWLKNFGYDINSIFTETVQDLAVVNDTNIMLVADLYESTQNRFYYDHALINFTSAMLLSLDSNGTLNYYKSIAPLNNPKFLNYTADSVRFGGNFQGSLAIDNVNLKAYDGNYDAFMSVIDIKTGKFDNGKLLMYGPGNDYMHFSSYDAEGNFYGTFVIRDTTRVFDTWYKTKEQIGEYTYVRADKNGHLNWTSSSLGNPTTSSQHYSRWVLPHKNNPDLMLLGGIYNGSVNLNNDTPFSSNLRGAWSSYLAWYNNDKFMKFFPYSPTAGSFTYDGAYYSQDGYINLYGSFANSVTIANQNLYSSDKYNNGYILRYKVDSQVAMPDAVSGNDTFCNAGSTKIWAQNPQSLIKWNNGSTADTLIVNTEGEYFYQYLHEDGFVTTSQKKQLVKITPAMPDLQIAGDSLYTTVSADSYQWFLDSKPVGSNQPYLIANKTGSYTVKYWINDCESPVSSAVNYTHIGMNDDLAKTGFSIYPNPANDKIFIQSKDFNSVINVSVCDVTGKELISLKNIKSGTISLDISKLEPQIYTVKIISNNEVFIQKIMKY